MLKKEDLEDLMVAEGEEVLSVRLYSLKIGDIVRARTFQGNVCFLEVTEVEWARVYIHKSKENKLGNNQPEEFFIDQEIRVGWAVLYGNWYTDNISSITIIRRK